MKIQWIMLEWVENNYQTCIKFNNIFSNIFKKRNREILLVSYIQGVFF